MQDGWEDRPHRPRRKGLRTKTLAQLQQALCAAEADRDRWLPSDYFLGQKLADYHEQHAARIRAELERRARGAQRRTA